MAAVVGDLGAVNGSMKRLTAEVWQAGGVAVPNSDRVRHRAVIQVNLAGTIQTHGIAD